MTTAVPTLASVLVQIPDPRARRGRLHPWTALLLLIVVARDSGALASAGLAAVLALEVPRRGPTRLPSQTWRTFLRHHAHHLWAADLFTVPTLAFKTLYVLVFIAHGRRELVHVKVTSNPTAGWVWRQLIEATPWGHKPRHLLRDRDAVYGRDFAQRAQRIGIDAIATPIRAPRANTVAERVIGTLRRECLDHLIVLDEQHLASVLSECVRYYNQERAHRTLGLETPEGKQRPVTGPIRSRRVLNGLHHVYERVA